jgi:hypothetical protein
MLECRENRISESHTFHRVEVNFCRTFDNSLQILAEVSKEDAPMVLLTTLSFMKIGTVRAVLYLRMLEILS